MSLSGDPAACRRLGLIGSVAVAGGGLACGALPVLSLTSPSHVAAGLVVVYFGLTLLIAAWWSLGRKLATVTQRWLRTTLGIWLLPLALGPPLFSRDVYSYLAQGAMVAAGIDVYRFGPSHLGGPLADEVPSIWQNTPAPYGPVFLHLAAAVAEVASADTLLGVAGLRLIALAGLALLVHYLPRLARLCHGDPRAALWLGALNPLVLLHFVAGAHNDAVMMGLLISGLAVAAHTHTLTTPTPPATTRNDLMLANPTPALTAASPTHGPTAAGSTCRLAAAGTTRGLIVGGGWVGFMVAAVLVALAGLVKAPAVLGLLAVICWWAGASGSWLRGFAGAVGAALATGFAATAIAGTGHGWMSALDTPASSTNWSLTNVGGRIGVELLRVAGSELAGLALPAARWLGIGAAAALAVIAWKRHSPVYALGLSLAGFALLGPAIRPWYLLWGLIPIAAAAPPGKARLRSAGLAGILTIVVFPNGYPPTVRQLGLAAAGCALAGIALWQVRARWSP